MCAIGIVDRVVCRFSDFKTWAKSTATPPKNRRAVKIQISTNLNMNIMTLESHGTMRLIYKGTIRPTLTVGRERERNCCLVFVLRFPDPHYNNKKS
jgi:hypothetical protein